MPDEVLVSVSRRTTKWGWYVQRADESDAFAFVVAALMLISIGWGIATSDSPNLDFNNRLTHMGLWKAVILSGWVILPPFWFWAEHFGIWMPTIRTKLAALREGPPKETGEKSTTVREGESQVATLGKDPELEAILHEWDIFKYGQDLTAKIWIAGASVLTIIYFGKDIKR
jgi:hypothetical protein